MNNYIKYLVEAFNICVIPRRCQWCLLGKKRSFGTANKKEIYPSQEELNTNKGLSGAGAQYFITDANDD